MGIPVAISIGTYDRILSLPYIYHGPVIDLPFFPIQLRFRGRPLHEWTMLLALLPVLWILTDLALGVLAVLQLKSLTGITYGIVHAAVTWVAASYLASFGYRKFISTDESFVFLALTAWTEAKRIGWARGPLDWWVLAAGIPLWFLVEWALSTAIHINELLLMVAATAIVRPVVLRLVHAFEPPERARRRAIDRAHRRAATITVSGEPHTHEAPQAQSLEAA
jgi:hypothetical protein